ncbi:hypothetical protein LguiB_021825 [Lonicera macranthoides]
MAMRFSPSLLFYLIALLLLLLLSLSSASSPSHFEGFDETLDDDDYETVDHDQLSDLPLRSPPPPTTLSHSDSESPENSSPLSDLPPKPSPSSTFDYYDEDEFEGLPVQSPPESPKFSQNDTTAGPNIQNVNVAPTYKTEIVCVTFLVVFLINYFAGRRENENIALAWAAKFATKDTIFEKNFSLLGVGEGEDSPLLMKEGQTVFKFYASGRRFCQGMLATMELQSRHDLIARLYNVVVPCRDEISFEVYMNDEAMDQVVFAMAKKKAAKTMQKEERDLQKFASFVSVPSNRKWVPEELAVISESKEVAGDLITEAVLDQLRVVDPQVPNASSNITWCGCKLAENAGSTLQGVTESEFLKNEIKYLLVISTKIAARIGVVMEAVEDERDMDYIRSQCLPVFGEKAYEKFGKGFISMQFSDQHPGPHKKLLKFKFFLPDANHMDDMTRLVALIPYYIDLIGRYKLSSQARTKTEGARHKIAQEFYRELQNARQEALQKKKAERKKMMEAADAKLSAEALRKKEAKERARQLKKAMPKIKITRGT